MPVYTYNCGVSGELKFIRGKFLGWIRAGRIIEERYAIFQRRTSVMLIPEHELTNDAKKILSETTAEPLTPSIMAVYREVINGRK